MSEEKEKINNNYEVEIGFHCRLDTQPGDFKDIESRTKIVRGEKCPLKGRRERLTVDHPADNVVGQAAAKAFPEACPLCGKKSQPGDFYVCSCASPIIPSQPK